MRALTVFAGGILVAFVVAWSAFLTGATASASTTAAGRAGGVRATAVEGSGGGSVSACTAYAYEAIRARVRVTGIPAECEGLSPGEVSFAATTAIKMAAGSGSKSVVRKRAGEAAPWVIALLGPPPVTPEAQAAGTGGGTGGPGSRLGFSDVIAQVGGLLAWLAAAASGGWILLRWWLAGGALGIRRHLRRLVHGSASTAPSAVIVAHVSLGLLGLVLWAIFMIIGSAPLAWACVGLLLPLAGLGMAVLLLGLPNPRASADDTGADDTRADAASAGTAASPASRPAVAGVLADDDVHGGTALLEAPADPPSKSRRSRGGMPVMAIAAHGVFVTVAIMFVILAAIGAG